MIFFIILISKFSFSHIVLDEVLTTDKIKYSLKDVCSKMVIHESPLIDIISSNTIDCMGKKIEVKDFCDKAMVQDPYYLRAYVDEASREVICHSGKKVNLKYQCTKISDQHLCVKDVKRNCLYFKEQLAKRLDYVEGSFSKSAKGVKEINCKFESLPLLKRSI